MLADGSGIVAVATIKPAITPPLYWMDTRVVGSTFQFRINAQRNPDCGGFYHISGIKIMRL
jgi:hypothetical protein